MVASQDLREAFLAFRGACIWLRKSFNTYRYLVEGDAETKQVIEKSAAWFFTDLQDILQQHCLLQACKITDPATSYSKTAKGRVDNLTVEHLCETLVAEKLNTADTDRLALQVMKYRPLVVEGRDRII